MQNNQKQTKLKNKELQLKLKTKKQQTKTKDAKQQEKNKTKCKQTGITMVALVITIIVLIILAGVTIATLSGDNGILSNATKAKLETEIAQDKEQLSLYYVDESMNDRDGSVGIDDYLNYKMHEKYSRETADVTENSNPAQSCGKEKRESDRTYGNGTLDHAHR